MICSNRELSVYIMFVSTFMITTEGINLKIVFRSISRSVEFFVALALALRLFLVITAISPIISPGLR